MKARKHLLTLFAAVACLGISHMTQAQLTIDFDELIPPGPDYSAGAGFSSQGVAFTGGVFNGWTYSNVNDTTTPGFTNQYAAYTGTDFSGSGNYAIGYDDGSFINLGVGQSLVSTYITNATYAALSMRDGDAFAKQFGGTSGDDEDFFSITFTGYAAVDGGGSQTGSVEFFLADYRFADNSQDYIVDTWELVDLTGLGDARSIGLTFASSDVGDFGVNTPKYVALDNLVLTPEPTSLMLLGAISVGVGLCRRRIC